MIYGQHEFNETRKCSKNILNMCGIDCDSCFIYLLSFLSIVYTLKKEVRVFSNILFVGLHATSF